MRYWLLRRPFNFTEFHSSTANTPWLYDNVFVDVRLKSGDVVYLTAANDALYGWGFVINRESYREQGMQSRAYRITVTQHVTVADLVTPAEIKHLSYMRELFTDSDRTLIALKAVHVNAFNALLRSKSVAAPPDLDSDEVEPTRIPKQDFPRIPLTPHIFTWLNEAYLRLRQGKSVKPIELLIELLTKLPEDFDYQSIDMRLMRYGVDLTLLGVLHVDPATDLVEKTDRVIRFIRELIIKEPAIEAITAEQISEDLTIPEDDVALTLGFISHFNNFWTSASRSGDKPGLGSITIQDTRVKREYLKYKGIDDLLEKLAAEQPNPNQQTITTNTTEPSSDNRPYDVCLSFAGEDRPYVERVAEALRNSGVDVFYDMYEQVSLCGKDLYQHLDSVYRTRARYCVVFISRAYSKKLWTKHELRSAQARAFEENREYILPVRLDETELPGVLPTTGYIGKKPPEELAKLIIAKLEQAEGVRIKGETAEPEIAKQREKKSESANSSIAILPFRNESGDTDDDAFCDGLTVKVINTLSNIEGLKVPPLSSNFYFDDKKIDVQEIGRRLEVGWIVKGSIKKAHNDLKITAHLVNTNDGASLQLEFSYSSDLDDILHIQIKITTDLVKALTPKLSITAKPSVINRHTVNSEAYRCFINGRYFFYQHTNEGWLKAIDYYEKATTIEPEYAYAYARLSSVLAFAWFYGAMHPDEAIEKWRNTSQRALELGDELAETHIAVGRFRFLYERNWKEAEREYGRASEIDPEKADAYQQYGLLLAAKGHVGEAIREAKRALRLERYSLLVNFHAAAIYWLCSKWDQALNQVETMIKLFPASNSAYWVKGLIYSMTGDYEKAIESYLLSIKLRDDNHALSSLAFTYGLSGQKSEALRVIDTLIERHKQRYDIGDGVAPYATAYNVAVAYGGLRESEAAFEWLKRAYRERNGDLVYLKVHSTIGGEGLWGTEFREDERFRKLLSYVGFR